MADYVVAIKFDDADSTDIFDNFDTAHKAAAAFVGKVNLGGVSGHNKLGVASHTRQKHF